MIPDEDTILEIGWRDRRIVELEHELIALLTPWEIEDKTGAVERPSDEVIAAARLLVGHT